MRTAIIYYTYSGNSAIVADVLSSELNCDVVELEEVTPRGKGFFAFMKSGIQAATGGRSKLTFSSNEKLGDYQQLFIITPVWASRNVPAVNTLLDELDFAEKRVAILTMQADGEKKGSNKVIADMTKRIEDMGGQIVGSCALSSNGLKYKVTHDNIADQIGEFLNNL